MSRVPKSEWHIGTSWGPHDNRGLVAQHSRADTTIVASWRADAKGTKIADALDRMAGELRKQSRTVEE